MPPQAARLLRILGGLTRQSEGRLGEPVKSRSSTWRASSPLLCNNSASTITTSKISTTGWLRPPARFSTASPLLPAPALAALLSQHHSHFLASPVGYLYERGDHNHGIATATVTRNYLRGSTKESSLPAPT